MKLVSRIALINLFCFIVLPAAADDIMSQQHAQQTSKNTENLAKYLQNLGGFLGYDLTQSPTANNQTVSQQLLSISTTQLVEGYVYNTFFGAMPVNAISTALSQFVPEQVSGAKIINALANTTFTYQSYSSPSSSNDKVSANSLIDQPAGPPATGQQSSTYQQDPVSQAVLNILGTPDVSYCMATDLSAFTPSCTYLYQNLVMNNVIGTIPDPTTFFSYSFNQPIIGQLNSNSLMGPLLYTDSKPSKETGSPSTPSTQSQNAGLTAQNQAQEAANFIRYASGAVAPGTLPQAQAYANLYNLAYPPTGTNVPPVQQAQAQATLSNYLANMRVFAAQSSVGVGNLYYILSKRLKQNQGGQNTTSQALSEFQLATWRLNNPNSKPDQQWVNQINTASSATVEKEIAILLAEINYQMYLDRQLQERILLTNSIMLIQNTRATQPTANFNNTGTNQ